MSNFQSLYNMIKQNIRTIIAFKAVVQDSKKRDKLKCLVIHVRNFSKLPSFIAVPLICGHVKGSLKSPSDITILLIHNYNKESLMEKSLRYVGIKNFIVLKIKFNGAWFNTLKLIELKNYLDSNSCQTKYIFYCDSCDAVLRDDPEKAINHLEEEKCDLLMSSTKFSGGYECMPEVKKWADQIASKSGYAFRYLNSGVYFGKTEFLREVVDSAVEYITDNDLPRKEYERLRENGYLCEHLTDFPKGVGCDQVILRYLHPRFYPRMKIDYMGRLALR